jgi:hypothetical protein
LKDISRSLEASEASKAGELDALNDEVGENDIPVSFRPGKARNSWQIFTSHGLVLISILNKPGRTIREIGLELNITDRAVALAIADLLAGGYLIRKRVGRRTFYQAVEDHPLKYPVSVDGSTDTPQLSVRALRAENLATHRDHLKRPPEGAS